METVDLVGVVVVAVGKVGALKEVGDVELVLPGERGRRVQQHSRTDDRKGQSKQGVQSAFLMRRGRSTI